MRRDVGFYFEAKIEQVYQAYLSAATHAPFDRSCKEEPYHAITFGLNFSGKYNMNGGSCTIHLMPSGTGTAVNIRFSLAQLGGGHCERYAQDLHMAMQSYLSVPPRPSKYNMDDFLKPANQVTPNSAPKAAAPVAKPASAPVVAAEPVVIQPVAATGGYCTNCGNALTAGSRFCSQCGTPVSAPTAKCCPKCNTQVTPNALFCNNCGTKL